MIEITKQVRTLAGMAKALESLIEAADKINSLEQFEAEHVARVNRLQQETADAEARLAESIEANKAAVAGSSRILADAEDKAAEIVEAAGRDAKRFRDEATAELHRAKGVALQLVADAKAKAEGEEARAAAAVAEREAAEAKLAELKAAIARIAGG